MIPYFGEERAEEVKHKKKRAVISEQRAGKGYS
jgi:hypothetical protein